MRFRATRCFHRPRAGLPAAIAMSLPRHNTPANPPRNVSPMLASSRLHSGVGRARRATLGLYSLRFKDSYPFASRARLRIFSNRRDRSQGELHDRSTNPTRLDAQGLVRALSRTEMLSA